MGSRSYEAYTSFMLPKSFRCCIILDGNLRCAKDVSNMRGKLPESIQKLLFITTHLKFQGYVDLFMKILQDEIFMDVIGDNFD